MAEPGDRASDVNTMLTTLGLLAAIAIGSIWTGLAVFEGRPGAVVLRFAVSVAGACYYLVLHRVASGRVVLPGRRAT